MAKLSKNLKEAQERLKRALKNKNSKEIAIASAEIVIHDSDVLLYEFILADSIVKKIETGEVEISKLNSWQIRGFVIREWKALKEKQKDKLKLSEEQERRVINGLAHALRKLKNKKRYKEQ